MTWEVRVRGHAVEALFGPGCAVGWWCAGGLRCGARSARAPRSGRCPDHRCSGSTPRDGLEPVRQVRLHLSTRVPAGLQQGPPERPGPGAVLRSKAASRTRRIRARWCSTRAGPGGGTAPRCRRPRQPGRNTPIGERRPVRVRPAAGSGRANRLIKWAATGARGGAGRRSALPGHRQPGRRRRRGRGGPARPACGRPLRGGGKQGRRKCVERPGRTCWPQVGKHAGRGQGHGRAALGARLMPKLTSLGYSYRAAVGLYLRRGVPAQRPARWYWEVRRPRTRPGGGERGAVRRVPSGDRGCSPPGVRQPN